MDPRQKVMVSGMPGLAKRIPAPHQTNLILMVSEGAGK